MHSTSASRSSGSTSISDDIDNRPLSKKSGASDHQRVQPQLAKAPVVQSGAAQTKSLGTRLIQKLTASTFRARQEVRQAYKAGDRALADLIKSVRSGNENAIRAASAKVTDAFSPLDRQSDTCPTEMALRGARMVRQIPSDEKLLLSLERSLDQLAQVGGEEDLPNPILNDPVVAHLQCAVKATILNNQALALEKARPLFGEREYVDMETLPAGDLCKLADLGEAASRLKIMAPGNQHRHDELPGTKITPIRLKSVAARGKEAAGELVAREKRFKELASTKSADIATMDLLKLTAMGEKLTDLAKSPRGAANLDTYKKVQAAITVQIKVLENAITESVTGPIGALDVKKLSDTKLLAMRKAAIAVPRPPDALVTAGIGLKAEIVNRKDLARQAFQGALQKAVSGDAASKAPDLMLNLVAETQKAVAKFARLGETLSNAELTRWINDTRPNLKTPLEPGLQRLLDSLNAGEGMAIRNWLSSHKTKRAASAMQSVDMLSKVLGAMLPAHPTPATAPAPGAKDLTPAAVTALRTHLHLLAGPPTALMSQAQNILRQAGQDKDGIQGLETDHKVPGKVRAMAVIDSISTLVEFSEDVNELQAFQSTVNAIKGLPTTAADKALVYQVGLLSERVAAALSAAQAP